MVVGIRAKGSMNLAYSIDFSCDGVKVGSPELHLPVGENVELVVDRSGTKTAFPGKVERSDGMQFIDRLMKSGNAFFVQIDDAEFSRFVSDTFYLF